MELTRETSRTRWAVLVAAWLIIAVLLVWHAAEMRDYMARLDGLGLRGAAAAPTPLRHTMPTMFADTQTWVRLALQLVETDAARIRFTEMDNAPIGREVHWSSAFAWLVAGGGWLRHLVTGEPLPLGIEGSLAWFNVPLLLATVVLISGWTARRAGAGAGLFVACGMVGSTEFYAGFAPGMVDHHGLLAAANLGVVLGAIFMGAGWWRNPPPGAGPGVLPSSREAARRAAVFSAISGAIGCWISAASVLPAIPIVGAAAVAMTLWHGRTLRREGVEFDPTVWRRWGTVGAAACFAFYLLEYAPNHLGLRLEVNHPLYALGWWGGGELVAQIAERFLGLPAPARQRWRLAAAVLAVAAAPATLLIGGARVFVIRDPLVLQLSAQITEGFSLRRSMQVMGSSVLLNRLPWAVAALVPAALIYFRRARAERLLLGFGMLTCAAFLGLGVWQVRFFANSGGPEICLVLVSLAVLAAPWSIRTRWLVVGATAAIALLPQRIYRLVQAERTLQAGMIARADVLQPVYRDMAATLRARHPGGDIILLTSPEASTAIGYYGRLKTIGTFYWENVAGVKAAAAMLAATSTDEARTLLRARHVTHVAVISENSFIPPYFAMRHPGAKPGAWQQSFGFQLLVRKTAPLWLEEIPHQPPPNARLPDLRVALFETRFGSAAGEAAYDDARAQAQAGRPAEAEQAIARALAANATAAEYWQFRSELLFARGDLDGALASIEECLAHAPAARRPDIASAAASGFYRKQARAAAVRLYRRSLADRYDSLAASNLAWILATAPDPALRDARAALTLAQRIAAESPNSYQAVTILAAALAENDRMPEAVSTETRALELARATGDPALVTNAETLLATFRAGRAWRQ